MLVLGIMSGTSNGRNKPANRPVCLGQMTAPG